MNSWSKGRLRKGNTSFGQRPALQSMGFATVLELLRSFNMQFCKPNALSRPTSLSIIASFLRLSIVFGLLSHGDVLEEMEQFHIPSPVNHCIASPSSFNRLRTSFTLGLVPNASSNAGTAKAYQYPSSTM